MIGELHHGMHGVLDDHDGDALAIHLPDDRQNALELVVSEAGERFVEQQKLWARRKGAGQFHQAKLLGGEPAR